MAYYIVRAMFQFIESPAFSEQIGDLMTDAEYAEFQQRSRGALPQAM